MPGTTLIRPSFPADTMSPSRRPPPTLRWSRPRRLPSRPAPHRWSRFFPSRRQLRAHPLRRVLPNKPPRNLAPEQPAPELSFVCHAPHSAELRGDNAVRRTGNPAHAASASHQLAFLGARGVAGRCRMPRSPLAKQGRNGARYRIHEVPVMAFCRAKSLLSLLSIGSALSLGALLAAGLAGAGSLARAQVFVVGEKSAMADVSTDFHPTRVELSTNPIDERGRRELIRDLVAEQGFAHRALPLGEDLVLMANGTLKPGGDGYKEMLYKKGQSAAPGDRVAITAVTVKPDRIVFDLNGGPYLKHRFLRHITLDDMPLVADDGAEVTGCRVTLLFEGGIPEVSAPEVKALLDPIIDFGVKTSAEAYADTLPQFLKDSINQHDVLVGMNSKMVLAAMGPPQSKVRELVPGSTDRHYEEWIYGQSPQTVRFVRFEI